MKLHHNFYIFLVALTFIVSACGGGGGSASGDLAASAVSTVSISSVSSSVVSFASSSQAILAPDNHFFSLDEGVAFKGVIQTAVSNVLAFGQPLAQGNSMRNRTARGGLVELRNESYRISFDYTPPQYFNGADEAVVYLNANLGNDFVEQKITLHFQIKPVADSGFTFDVQSNKLFVSGDQVQLGLPYLIDTKETLPLNSNLKLSIDDVPLDYAASNEGITFSLPANLSAGTNHVKIELDYLGEKLSAKRTIKSKIDYGSVEYLMGDKDRPGVTYVVFSDNTSDKNKYLEWINKDVVELLDMPIVSRYSSYWNFAVIKEPAPETYSFALPDSRILVGDLKTTGAAYVKQFVPNVDWIILNTGLSGRATGGYPMVVNYGSIYTFLHEFGHVHAKLADEYEDAVVNANPSYIEGSNPNVTLYNSYDSIPWKHWILDKNTIPRVGGGDIDGVGAFLGAYYTSQQFYRPMFLSVMGNPFMALGPVNSEAWVLATYEHLGLLASVASTKESNIRNLTIAKPWNKNITRVEWFLNDVKQDEWTNKSSIAIDESTLTSGTYSVRAELIDLLGYIKNPSAYAAFNNVTPDELLGAAWKNKKNESFQKSWNFEKVASAKLQKIQSADHSELAVINDRWVSHSVVIKNGEHELTQQTSYNFLDTLAPVTVHSELRADIVDNEGRKIYSVGINHPYASYHENDRLVSLTGRGAYQIKHPFIRGSYQINIVDLRAHKMVAHFSVDANR